MQNKAYLFRDIPCFISQAMPMMNALKTMHASGT